MNHVCGFTDSEVHPSPGNLPVYNVILTCCINYGGFMVGYSLIKLISPHNPSISVFIRKFSMMIYRLLSSLSGIYPPIYTNGTWAWVRKREQHLWAFISLLYTHTHPPLPPPHLKETRWMCCQTAHPWLPFFAQLLITCDLQEVP